jgi:hypothetical protein
MSCLLSVAPHFEHECLRLPPEAVMPIRLLHIGQAFWLCRWGESRIRDSTGKCRRLRAASLLFPAFLARLYLLPISMHFSLKEI